MSRVWVETPDGSNPYRRDDQRFSLDLKIGRASVVAEDDLFRVVLTAVDEAAASTEAASLLLQLFHLKATIFRPGVHRITATVLATASFQSEGDSLRRLTAETGTVYLYDLDSLRLRLAEAAKLLQSTAGDARLKQALRYYGLGDDLSQLLARSTTADYGSSLAPIRFLQYWKSLTTIIGDPSKDRDHQSRPANLGLGRQFFRKIAQPLHEIRNRFGVAHIADPDAPQFITDANVTACRDAAADAIHAYIRSMSPQGGGSFSRRAILARRAPSEGGSR